MNKKIMLVLLIIILVILGIILFIFFNSRKENKSMNNNYNNGNVNVSDFDNSNFNFETRTVTLNSGYEMPLNGIGTYSLTGNVAYDSIRSALDSGVRLIDTAYMYGNEEEIGRAIRDSGIPREEIFVITKIYPSQFDDQ